MQRNRAVLAVLAVLILTVISVVPVGALAWYDTDYISRMPYTLDNTAGENIARTFEPVVQGTNNSVYVYSTNLDGSRCNETIRVTNSTGAIFPFYLVANGTNYCNITWLANVSANTAETYYVYYNNPTSTDPQYALRRIMRDNFENYTSTAQMKNRWVSEFAVALQTSGCFHGSNCMDEDGGGGSAVAAAQFNWSTAPETNAIWLSLWTKRSTSDTDANSFVIFPTTFGVNQVLVATGATTANRLEYYASGAWVDTGATVASGIWNNIKINASAATDAYGVTLNGSYKSSGGFTTAVSTLESIRLRLYSGADGRWDDVEAWNADFNQYGDPLVVTAGAEEGQDNSVYLGGIANITYDAQMTAYCHSSAICALLRNGTDVTATENGTAALLHRGGYNYTATVPLPNSTQSWAVVAMPAAGALSAKYGIIIKFISEKLQIMVR